MSLQLPPELKEQYPAKLHTHKVIDYLRAQHPTLFTDSSNPILYLEAAHTRLNEDNDQAAPFRQRRYFFYFTGCELPDSALLYDTESDKSTLFIPPIDEDEVIWSGLPLLPNEAKATYDIDNVQTTDKLENVFSWFKNRRILAIKDQTSHPIFASGWLRHLDTTILKEAIEECRVTKTPYEVALIKYANAISSIAHKAVMRHAKHATNERELEALFIQQCAHNGARNQAYDAIVASGTDAATLHYVRNDKVLLTADVGELQVQQQDGGKEEKKGQKQLNLLIDAGAEVRCYASDVTRTFPLNGSFSEESREVYELVLRMQKECMKMLRAGVLWEDCHRLAHEVLIEGLLGLGILKDGTVKELMDSRISTAFLPHGLGHYMGMDTHDTGGHADYADKDPVFRYLRVRGKVPADAVITVEPGCYFCRFIIEPRLKTDEGKKYIDADVLEKYWSVGGVRIEDDVLVHEDSCENLTQDLSSEVEDLERIVKGE